MDSYRTSEIKDIPKLSFKDKLYFSVKWYNRVLLYIICFLQGILIPAGVVLICGIIGLGFYYLCKFLATHPLISAYISIGSAAILLFWKVGSIVFNDYKNDLQYRMSKKINENNLD